MNERSGKEIKRSEAEMSVKIVFISIVIKRKHHFCWVRRWSALFWKSIVNQKHLSTSIWYTIALQYCHSVPCRKVRPIETTWPSRNVGYRCIESSSSNRVQSSVHYRLFLVWYTSILYIKSHGLVHLEVTTTYLIKYQKCGAFVSLLLLLVPSCTSWCVWRFLLHL